MRVQTGWLLILAFVCSFLLDLGLASSSSTTPSPTTPPPAPTSSTSSSATPSPGATPAPTLTSAPTTSSSSSSSSGTSRGTVVAWALFTVLVAVGLLVFLYKREQNKRTRIRDGGESLRQSLSSADAMRTYAQQGAPLGQGSDPIMSSF